MRPVDDKIAFLLLTSVLLGYAGGSSHAQNHLASITRLGWQPQGLALDRVAGVLYVTDLATNAVYAYDAATFSPAGSVAVSGMTLTGQLLVDEAAGKLYATANPSVGGTVAILDTSPLGFIVARATPGGGRAVQLAHDPTLGQIYGLSSGGLIQIDTTTDAATLVPDVTSTANSRIAVNPVTSEVFVSRFTDPGTLQIVQGATLQRTGLDGYNAIGVGVNPFENKVYLTYGLQIHDRDTGLQIALPNFNDTTSNPVYSAATNRMYTSSEVNQLTSIIDGATDTLVDLPLLGGRGAVAARATTGHVYYGNADPAIMLDEATQQLYFVPLPDAPSTGLLFPREDLVVDDASGRVYALNGGHVEVLQDTAVPQRPPLYVGCADNSSKAIFVIDPLTGERVDTWNAAYPGEQLAIRPGGGRLWLAAPSTDEGSDLVQGYWGTTSAYGPRFASFASGGNDPTTIAFTPDGSRLYAANRASNTVSVIDPEAQSVVTQVAVGVMPWGVAATPTKVYVANRGAASVSAINRATNAVVATIPVASGPYGVAAHPAGTRIFVANSTAATVSVIDTHTDTVVDTIAVGTTPHWLAIAPDGRSGVVGNFGGTSATVFDTGSGDVVTTVPVGANPEGVAFLADGSRFFVVLSNTSAASSVASVAADTFAVTTFALPGNSRSAVALAIPDPTARVAGRVTGLDVPLAGATIDVYDDGMAVAGSTATNAAGDYAVANLAPGTYSVRFAHAGYPDVVRSDVEIDAGEVAIQHADFNHVVFQDGFEASP